MANQTITAVFSTVAEAEAASRDLAMQIGGVRGSIFTNQTGTADLGIAGTDRATLEEAVRRGHAVLSATVPAAQFDTAADVVEAAGAIDLDAQEAEWRSAGWTGGNALGSADMGTARLDATPVAPQAAPARAAATGSLASGQEESIPLLEERLRVGKRETAHGRVKVRSYVVETPVEEQVSLHSEHVQVDRRAVDRPVTGADALFQERTIEATETAEEAVVAKEARVREELVIRKTAEDTTETVKGTVRRTEVEVQDERGATRPATGPARDPGA
ncbi:YsnF/AvaK domain-containing protein [Dankookia sp. GCM10030260]|uniref:YsnF/AvaK domain-containing protein n=1 Tax=Dankookia sp. GCM10030260 TaxID=3273390 RepID=UPI0036149438